MYKELISKIKEKKPLNRLEDEFIIDYVEDFLNKNYKLKTKFENNSLKKSDVEKIVKNIRNELNRVYGQFWINTKDNKLEVKDIELHKSSKERKEFYELLYKKIFEITGKPKTILDIGAGLNPLSYSLIGKDVYYYVNELSVKDCEAMEKYLEKNNFKFNILKGNVMNFKELPKTDICFLFKFLDTLDVKGHKLSEELIKRINSEFIVVSFSSVNVRNKKMNFPRRGWFEIMLKRLGFNFKKIEFTNEFFYILNK